MASPNPIEGFDRLSNAVSICRPGTPQNRCAPLIVLCNWVAASPKHIAKYREVYRQLYTTATVLLVQTSINDVGLSWAFNAQQSRIQSAREVISEHFDNDPSGEIILIHAFSNGGAVTIAKLFESMFANRDGVFKGAMILDSCPGEGTYLRTVPAFIISVSLHKLPTVLYAVGSAAAYAFLFPFLAVPNMTGFEKIVSKSRRLLNDSSLVHPKTPRLYLYSKTDELVCWEDVQSHIQTAKQHGFEDVREILWDRGEHCAHIWRIHWNTRMP
jgi:hypothetical protein